MKRVVTLIVICLCTFLGGPTFAKGKDLAIISASRFDNYVYQYKMWKSLEGFDVTIKKADSLGGLDTTNVWQWIHNTWWPGNDNYVFILGKQSEVPSNRVVDPWVSDPNYSDWFYAAHSHATLLMKNKANLIIGRLPGASNHENTLKKLLSHEFSPKSYNPKIVSIFAAYESIGGLDFAWHGRSSYKAFTDCTWTAVDTVMFDVSPFNAWLSSSYRDSLEKRWAKSSIIYYYGHGSYNSFASLNSLGFEYNCDEALPLITINGYQYILSNGCHTAILGRFIDSVATDYNSILDQLVGQTSSSLQGPVVGIGQAASSRGLDDAWHSDPPPGHWSSHSSASLTDSVFNTWGAIFRGAVRQLIGPTDSSYITHNQQFIGDPSISFRTTDPSIATVAPSSYISVSSPAVVAFTGSDVGSVRVSAYAPNTGWFSTTTLTGNTYTTFTTTARPLFISFTKDDASKTPTVWTTGGTLNVNTWMLGNINVNGDLTVASGKTMEILPGTKMYFRTNYDDRSAGASSSKAELLINGTLKADSATFTRKESSSYWTGIRFGTTAVSSHIIGCTLSYAVIGIYINEADPTITNSIIHNNDTYGVYVTGTGAWPTIKNSYLGGDDYALYIYATSSGGNYGHDAFIDATYGLFLANGSPCIEGESNGANTWDYTLTNKRVYAYNGYLELGTDENPGENFFSKGSDNTKDYIYNTSGITVYARQCCYYDCPNPDTDWFYGSVDRANKLSLPPIPLPGPDFYIPKIAVTPMRQYAEIKRTLAGGATFSHSKALNTLVLENIETEFAARPLDLMLGNLSKEEGQKVINNFSKYNKMHEAVRFALDQWQIRYASQDNAPDEALFLKYLGTKFEKAMALTYAAGLAANGQKDRAVEVLTKANQDTDPLVLNSLIAGLGNPESIPMQKAEAGPTVKQSVEITAFPNPFNSESRIQFRLAQKGLATVTIYNMLGQKVVELVNGEKNAGPHIITWDGRNQVGSQVPTGVYFCQIMVGGTRKTMKLFMLR